jgi:hypothetical protein
MKHEKPSPAVTERPLSILCLVAVILLGAIDSQSRTSTRGSDHLIVAGQRIGSVAIGMTAAQLFDLMGDPTDTLPYTDGHSYSWGDNANGRVLTAWVLTKSQRVVSCLTTNPQFVTPEGIHVGDSELALEAKLGAAERRLYGFGRVFYSYRHGSLGFIVRNGRIDRITIPFRFP